AGPERATGTGLRLPDAAHGTLGISGARAAGPEPHPAAVPRALPHDPPRAALVRGTRLPVHQQEERAVDARRGGVAGAAPGVPGRSDRATRSRLIASRGRA